MRIPKKFIWETSYKDSQEKKANVQLPCMAVVGNGTGVAGSEVVPNRSKFYFIQLYGDPNRLTQCYCPFVLTNGDIIYVQRARDRDLSHYEFVEFIQAVGGGVVPPIAVHDHHNVITGGDALNPETISPQTFLVGPAPCPHNTLGAAVTAVNAAGPPASGTEYVIQIQGGTYTEGAADITIPDYTHVKGKGEGSIIDMGSYGILMGDYSSLQDLVILTTGQNASKDAAVDVYADTAWFFHVRVILSPADLVKNQGFQFRGDSIVEAHHCTVETTAGGTNVRGFVMDGADAAVVLHDCIASDSTNFDDALWVDNHVSTIITEYCRFAGATNDVSIGAAATWNSYKDQIDPLNCAISGTADMLDVNAGDSFATKVKNTSGGAVTTGAPGYIDENGEFKTTATAYLDVAWCVVVIGGPNNGVIWVARRGRVTVTLNGNCAIGDKLYTSTTAGQAQPQSYMRPEMFGIALTANGVGAGGTCEALLYCHTKPVLAVSAAYLFYVSAAPQSDFRAQINEAAPIGAVVDYDNDTGEESIDVATANQLAKIRLYNETDADYALIDSVNTAGVGGQITLTAAAPAGWDNNEWITARSQTCVIAGPPYYFDLDLSSADNTAVPELARSIMLEIQWNDSGAAGNSLFVHPWEAYAAGQVVVARLPVANQTMNYYKTCKLIQRRFCVMWTASGAATAFPLIRLVGYGEAAP